MMDILKQIERSKLILTATSRTIEIIETNVNSTSIKRNEIKGSIKDIIEIERELTASLEKIGNH